MKSKIKYISLWQALTGHRKNLGVIIDVRDSAEFKSGHINRAVNLPASRFSAVNYIPYTYDQIYLIDQSGIKAQEVAQKLLESGYKNVFVINQQMENINLATIENSWSFDHQPRIFSGLWLSISTHLWFGGKSEA